jgi:hypothetical protein
MRCLTCPTMCKALQPHNLPVPTMHSEQILATKLAGKTHQALNDCCATSSEGLCFQLTTLFKRRWLQTSQNTTACGALICDMECKKGTRKFVYNADRLSATCVCQWPAALMLPLRQVCVYCWSC